MLDTTPLTLQPEQSRTARAFFGWSQAKAAEESGLRIDKLKRFEAGAGRAGTYVPDADFLTALRSFYERNGYQFGDSPAPGASARETGLVFPAGVVGAPDPADAPPPGRRIPTTIHHMRIALTDEDEMGQLLDMIESNEARVRDLLAKPIENRIGIFAGISEATEKRHAQAIRLMADNGVMFGRLFGRDIGGKPDAAVLAGTKAPATNADLLHKVQADVHRAASGDPDAKARQTTSKAVSSTRDALGLS